MAEMEWNEEGYVSPGGGGFSEAGSAILGASTGAVVGGGIGGMVEGFLVGSVSTTDSPMKKFFGWLVNNGTKGIVWTLSRHLIPVGRSFVGDTVVAAEYGMAGSIGLDTWLRLTNSGAPKSLSLDALTGVIPGLPGISIPVLGSGAGSNLGLNDNQKLLELQGNVQRVIQEKTVLSSDNAFLKQTLDQSLERINNLQAQAIEQQRQLEAMSHGGLSNISVAQPAPAVVPPIVPLGSGVKPREDRYGFMKAATLKEKEEKYGFMKGSTASAMESAMSNALNETDERERRHGFMEGADNGTAGNGTGELYTPPAVKQREERYGTMGQSGAMHPHGNTAIDRERYFGDMSLNEPTVKALKEKLNWAGEGKSEKEVGGMFGLL